MVSSGTRADPGFSTVKPHMTDTHLTFNYSTCIFSKNIIGMSRQSSDQEGKPLASAEVLQQDFYTLNASPS